MVVSSIVYTFLHLEGICEFSDAFHRRDLKLLVVMSFSWNFSAQAKPSYEGFKPSQAGALQFSSWNRTDKSNNMDVKK